MNARLIGGAALIAVALIVVPDKNDRAVQPVAETVPDTILCDQASVETVVPDTFGMRVYAGLFCAQRFAADAVYHIARGAGMDGEHR